MENNGGRARTNRKDTMERDPIDWEFIIVFAIIMLPVPILIGIGLIADAYASK